VEVIFGGFLVEKKCFDKGFFVVVLNLFDLELFGGYHI